MEKKEVDNVVDKVMEKQEFSELLREDVEFVVRLFVKRGYIDRQLVKECRNYLRKIFSCFSSPNLLKGRKLDSEKILLKHKSTRERFEFYEEIYGRIFRNCRKKLTVIDLGAGVNGFSFGFFKEKKKIRYVGVEGVGQFVRMMNNFFREEKIRGKVHHLSLFDLDEIRNLVESIKGEKVIFLFKTIDSLEMYEKDYSKKFILELSSKWGKEDLFVVSFATHSLGKRERLKVKRCWILNFIKDNFNLIDDFEAGGERYVVFKNR